MLFVDHVNQSSLRTRLLHFILRLHSGETHIHVLAPRDRKLNAATIYFCYPGKYTNDIQTIRGTDLTTTTE